MELTKKIIVALAVLLTTTDRISKHKETEDILKVSFDIKNIKYCIDEILIYQYFYNLTEVKPSFIVLIEEYLFIFVTKKYFYKTMQYRIILKAHFKERKVILIKDETPTYLIRLLYTFFSGAFIETLLIEPGNKEDVVELKIFSVFSKTKYLGNLTRYVGILNKFFERHIRNNNRNLKFQLKIINYFNINKIERISDFLEFRQNKIFELLNSIQSKVDFYIGENNYSKAYASLHYHKGRIESELSYLKNIIKMYSNKIYSNFLNSQLKKYEEAFNLLYSKAYSKIDRLINFVRDLIFHDPNKMPSLMISFLNKKSKYYQRVKNGKAEWSLIEAYYQLYKERITIQEQVSKKYLSLLEFHRFVKRRIIDFDKKFTIFKNIVDSKNQHKINIKFSEDYCIYPFLFKID